MESAFARLFRTSKLASYDRSIKQVYATYPEAFAQGDWGLKRPVPKKVTTRLVTIESIDSKEQIMQLESANRQYMTVNAWKENFTNSHSPGVSALDSLMQGVFNMHVSPDPRDGSESSEATGTRAPPRSLGLMTRSEWRQFLEEARLRRAEWKNALEEGLFAPEETLSFMNATNLYNATGDGVHRLPTYHDYVSASEDLQVQGRVLNRMAAGFAVAVQGIVAYLPVQGHSQEVGFQYRDVKTFYVHSASFDSQGRPDVHLGIRPRGARESLAVFDSGSKSSFAYSKQPDGAAGVKSEHLLRIRSMLRLNNTLVGGQAPSEGTGSNEVPGNKPAGGSDPVSDALDLLNKTRH
ncbi:hypothetical protein IW152_001278 [Coemansia sp. BCRC 34962]|nr:hypothetical protein IW152_001278 [Coemansia sp. BCRC 34962]